MRNTVTKLFGARCPTSGRRVAPFSRSLLHSPPQTRLTQKPQIHKYRICLTRKLQIHKYLSLTPKTSNSQIPKLSHPKNLNSTNTKIVAP